jgi:hypothetical protein
MLSCIAMSAARWRRTLSLTDPDAAEARSSLAYEMIHAEEIKVSEGIH